jgi:taurine dioxygenase
MTVRLPEVIKLEPFGCEIRGVDFTQDLSPKVQAAIHQAFVENGIVLVREGIADNDAHMRLSRCFGEPQPAVTKKLNSNENPYMMMLDFDPAKNPTNTYEVDGKRLNHWLGWHWDQAFVPEIVRGACLRSTMPASEGGITGWIHGGQAYDRLSPALQARIDKLDVVYKFQGAQEKNRFGYPWRVKSVNRSAEQIASLDKYDAAFPAVVHPLVITLPETGRKILNLSPMHARYVLGVDETESADLLTELGNVLTDERYAYFHRWTANDVVAWDNWATVHMACGIPEGVSRGARRTTISGDYRLGRYLDASLDAASYRERLPD